MTDAKSLDEAERHPHQSIPPSEQALHDCEVFSRPTDIADAIEAAQEIDKAMRGHVEMPQAKVALRSAARAIHCLCAHLRSLAPPPAVKAEANRNDHVGIRCEFSMKRGAGVSDEQWADAHEWADMFVASLNMQQQNDQELRPGSAVAATREGAAQASREGSGSAEQSTTNPDASVNPGTAESGHPKEVTAVPEGAMPEVLPPGSRWRCTGGVNIRQGVFINGARRDEGGYRGYSTYLDCEGSVVSAAHEKHIAEHWIDWTHHLSMQDPAAGRTGEELRRLGPWRPSLFLGPWGDVLGIDEGRCHEGILEKREKILEAAEWAYELGREFERSLTPSHAPGSVELSVEEWEALEECVNTASHTELARQAFRKLKESK